MPRPPSLNRVILLGWVVRTRIGTNQFGEKYFTFTLATSKFVDADGEKARSYDMHYVTVFGPDNVRRAIRDIKYKAYVMIEGFLRYHEKRDPETQKIIQRYTYIQVEYWQVCKEGNDDRPPIEHESTFRTHASPEDLRRVDNTRDTINRGRTDGQGQD